MPLRRLRGPSPEVIADAVALDARRKSYLAATRHPWPCLLFLLPLLAAYECGVLWLGGNQADALRNGADAWLRWGLEASGVYPLYWPAGLIAVVFVGWTWVRRYDRPHDLTGTLTGMAIESVAFALGLWLLSRALGPVLDQLGVALTTPSATQQATGQVITFVGAGIYEELFFRLVLFSGLVCFLRLGNVPTILAVPAAVIASAVAFSAAHHVGPYGEAFDGYVFLFRLLAGLYFALLYQLRGFGIAVGAHACYDVMVGIALG
jgi:membrane protease YdiL (CAAX protease family)